jgi:hypothetical protein
MAPESVAPPESTPPPESTAIGASVPASTGLFTQVLFAVHVWFGAQDPHDTIPPVPHPSGIVPQTCPVAHEVSG